jgi:hypothetical protein
MIVCKQRLMFCLFLFLFLLLLFLELVHSHIWGPSPIVSSHDYKYYILFIYGYSHFTWIYFFTSKSEVCEIFSSFKAQVKNLLNTSIKIFRTDGGTKYKPIASKFLQILH